MQVFKNSRTALATAMTSAALLGAASVAGLSLVLDDGAPAAAPQVTVTNAAAATSSSSSTVGEIYKRSADAVVKITVTSAGQASPMGGSGGTQQAQGSGFVYDTDGHVITNQHVVDGAESVSVKFANGKTYPATVVGTDPSTDLAVIDVDAPASALKPLELADSSAVEVGDGVIAIGSPFGLDQTVTTGIVSALHRQISSPNNYRHSRIRQMIAIICPPVMHRADSIMQICDYSLISTSASSATSISARLRSSSPRRPAIRRACGRQSGR